MDLKDIGDLAVGTQIEYRPYGRRKWFPAVYMYMGFRNDATIKTPDGSEYEVNINDIRMPESRSPAPRKRRSKTTRFRASQTEVEPCPDHIVIDGTDYKIPRKVQLTLEAAKRVHTAMTYPELLRSYMNQR